MFDTIKCISFESQETAIDKPCCAPHTCTQCTVYSIVYCVWTRLSVAGTIDNIQCSILYKCIMYCVQSWMYTCTNNNIVKCIINNV